MKGNKQAHFLCSASGVALWVGLVGAGGASMLSIINRPDNLHPRHSGHDVRGVICVVRVAAAPGRQGQLRPQPLQRGKSLRRICGLRIRGLCIADAEPWSWIRCLFLGGLTVT